MSFRPQTLSGPVADTTYLRLDTTNDPLTNDLVGPDFVKTRSGSITRNGSGYITKVTKTGGRTLDVTRDVNNFITSVTDGVRTYTLTRNGSNQVISWTVA